jgi:hypothetical protein
MKPLFRFKRAQVLVAVIGLSGAAFGQNKLQPAHFRFVNAAGLAGKVALTIDTLKLKPEGFIPGDTTGAVGILPGSHKVTIASAEAGKATATVALLPNTPVTMIAYCKATVDPRTNTLKRTLHLLQRVNPPPDAGRHFQLLYVSSQPFVDVVMNGAPVRINSMRELKGAELPGGDLKVEQAGKSVVRFTAPQAGNYLVVLYDVSGGGLAGVVLPDYK